MWWLIWILLVLGALGAAALLGLRLWRQVKALGREAGTLAEAAGRLSAPGEPADLRPRYVPGALGEESTLDAARGARERVRAARLVRRQGRLDRSAARWRAAGLVGDHRTPDVAGSRPPV